jgi:hypothetical protein
MTLNISCSATYGRSGTCGWGGACGWAAPARLVVLSHGVVASVDGAGRAGAGLDDELLPAKELEYVLERRPCTSHSALQASSNNWVMLAYSL